MLETVGRSPWTGCQPDARAPQMQKKRWHTSLSWVWFEPTILVFEHSNAFLALGRSTTVVGVVDCLVLLLYLGFLHCVVTGDVTENMEIHEAACTSETSETSPKPHLATTPKQDQHQYLKCSTQLVCFSIILVQPSKTFHQNVEFPVGCQEILVSLLWTRNINLGHSFVRGSSSVAPVAL
jgi:hypothetical protein